MKGWNIYDSFSPCLLSCRWITIQIQSRVAEFVWRRKSRFECQIEFIDQEIADFMKRH